MNKSISILGIRGIPARHGGFETFAERLALHLAGQGWAVRVYCQDTGGREERVESWKGVELMHIPVRQDGPLGTVFFDWRAARHAARERRLLLTLGYNTAVFSAVYRVKRMTHLMNMDGLEWQRRKWSLPARAWLYANEHLGCWLGDHLIADHPAILAHLSHRTRASKITMIPYGADPVMQADAAAVKRLGLEPSRYALVVARPEPENSLFEVVSAFSRASRGVSLAVLGQYHPLHSRFHKLVLRAGGPEVRFLGPIYDKDVIAALRYHSRFYIHGHRVGGTNPSLVEALGAGCAILCHDNRFNRWVAGDGARYFSDADDCDAKIAALCSDDAAIEELRAASRERYAERFTWERTLEPYVSLLESWAARVPRLPFTGMHVGGGTTYSGG